MSNEQKQKLKDYRKEYYKNIMLKNGVGRNFFVTLKLL